MLRNIPGFVKKVLPFLRKPVQDLVPAPLPAEPRPFRRRGRTRTTMPRKWWLKRQARLHMARESRRVNRR